MHPPSGQAQLARHATHVEALRLKSREQREELAGARREVRHLRKTMRTLEVRGAGAGRVAPGGGAPQHDPVPPPPTQPTAQALALPQRGVPAAAMGEARVVERIVEVADPGLQARLGAAECEARRLAAERSVLQQEVDRLSDALAAASRAEAHARATSASEVEQVRRVAEERLAAAAAEATRGGLQQQRLKARGDGQLCAHNAGDESLGVQLAAALQRQQELEQGKAVLEAEVGRCTAAAAAARAATSPQHPNVDSLRTELEAARAELEVLRRKLQWAAAVDPPHAGFGAVMEDTGDDSALAADVQALRSELRTTSAARSEMQRRVQALEQQLQQAVAVKSAETSELRSQVECLRADKAALREQARQLRQQASDDAAEISRLSRQQQQSDCAAAPGVRDTATRNDAARGMPSTASIPAVIPGRGHTHHASQDCDVQLSAAAKAQFQREMRHLLHGHSRPGVVSRFPHALRAMLGMRKELQGELTAEVEAELACYGISAQQPGLSHAEYEAAMAQLHQRRAAARAGLSTMDAERMDYMRATVGWHVHQVAASQRAAQETTALPPSPQLPPIRECDFASVHAAPVRAGGHKRLTLLLCSCCFWPRHERPGIRGGTAALAAGSSSAHATQHGAPGA